MTGNGYTIDSKLKDLVVLTMILQQFEPDNLSCLCCFTSIINAMFKGTFPEMISQ